MVLQLPLIGSHRPLVAVAEPDATIPAAGVRDPQRFRKVRLRSRIQLQNPGNFS
jgi:hypothetical protein